VEVFTAPQLPGRDIILVGDLADAGLVKPFCLVDGNGPGAYDFAVFICQHTTDGKAYT